MVNPPHDRITYETKEYGKDDCYHYIMLDGKELLMICFGGRGHQRGVDEDRIHIHINPQFYGLKWKVKEAEFSSHRASVDLEEGV